MYVITEVSFDPDWNQNVIEHFVHKQMELKILSPGGTMCSVVVHKVEVMTDGV